MLVGCLNSTEPEEGQSNELTWTEHYSGVGQTLRGIAHHDGTFHAVGQTGTYFTCTDAITWTSRNTGSTTTFLDVSMNGPVYLLMGYFEILRSFDMQYWIPVWTSTLKEESLIWTGSMYVVVGGDHGLLLTSTNGSEWTVGDPGTMEWLMDVEWNGSRLVAVGLQGTIITSIDGISWSTVASGTTSYLSTVLWNGERFIAVGEYGTIVTSPDGLNWTVQQSVTGEVLMCLAWSGNLLVSGGQNGVVISSLDGFEWSVREGGSDHVRDIIYEDGRFIAVGDKGKVYVSNEISSNRW